MKHGKHAPAAEWVTWLTYAGAEMPLATHGNSTFSLSLKLSSFSACDSMLGGTRAATSEHNDTHTYIHLANIALAVSPSQRGEHNDAMF